MSAFPSSQERQGRAYKHDETAKDGISDMGGLNIELNGGFGLARDEIVDEQCAHRMKFAPFFASHDGWEGVVSMIVVEVEVVSKRIVTARSRGVSLDWLWLG